VVDSTEEVIKPMCHLCGGPLNLLGQLGRLIWLRCRNCGMEFSTESEEEAA
jgi:tRNA(Ile2) C34 agmatinyltransferase TiaS